MNAPPRHVVDLPTGTLTVTVDRADLPLDRLCGFAARRNPKRGFLFVSRVLGRHIPVRPSAMRESYRRLAAKLPTDLPGPVLVIGMAETACGLGEGVHEEYVARTGRDDVGYLSTTRFALDAPLLAAFEEPHSHATRHRLYRAGGVPDAALDAVRSVVLVDDEATTGTTFRNLDAALRAALPRVERTEAVVLTDWSGGRDAGLPVHALLAGAFEWRGRAMPAEPPPPPADSGDAPLEGRVVRSAGGRWGTLGIAAMPPAAAEPPGDGPIRVLGFGECVHLPFRVAEDLEARGHAVTFQAVTRSPIRLGGAIGSALAVPDPYGEGVAYHLYNHDPAAGRTLLVHELSRPAAVAPALRALGAGRAAALACAPAPPAEVA